MIYLVCARCHDSHKAAGAYGSRARAEVMAELGNELELKHVTRHYIALARAAETDEERDHWAHAIVNAKADGMAHWYYYVEEVVLS